MTTADRAIASLRAHHDRLADVVASLSPQDLEGPSAAEKWTIAQVLSHLGSGAEIFLPRWQAAVDGAPAPAIDNQTIWKRWDESSPEEQAAGFLEHDEALVSLLESLGSEQRESLQVDLGFGDPLPVAAAAGQRLNEVAAHAWDVRAGLDPSALLDAEAADLLLEGYAGPSADLLGWIGKADRLDGETTVAAGAYTLSIGSSARLASGTSDAATATFHGPHEALVRLLLGRLKDGYTAADVTVTGNVSLDDLRRVFPGY